MENYKLIKLREHPKLGYYAAEWLHQKWHIPTEAYLESVDASLKNTGAIP